MGIADYQSVAPAFLLHDRRPRRGGFFTLRPWVGHIDEEALKIYVHIADGQAQVPMRPLAERRQAAGPATPDRGRKGIGTVSAPSRR